MHVRGINNSLVANNKQNNRSDVAVKGYVSQGGVHAARKTTNYLISSTQITKQPL